MAFQRGDSLKIVYKDGQVETRTLVLVSEDADTYQFNYTNDGRKILIVRKEAIRSIEHNMDDVI